MEIVRFVVAGGDRPLVGVSDGSTVTELGETLGELLRLVAERLGANPRLVPLPASEIREAGLDPVRISPFSGRWMSFLDPSRAKAELGFRHEALGLYIDKIVTIFLACPPAAPPEGYATRAAEVALARRSLG